jgi:hypothetical protein
VIGLTFLVVLLGMVVRGAVLRGLWPFAALLVLGLLMAFGPERTLFGHPVKMPFAYLAEVLPGLKASRYPAAFVRLANLSMALLAAAGLSRLRPRWQLAAASLVLPWAFLCFARPVAFQPMPFEEVHQIIARDPVPGTVLELPPDTEVMRRRSALGQILHEKPLLGAPITRVRPEAIEFFNGTPVVRRMMAPPSPHVLDSPKIQLEMRENREILDRYRVRYIVIRPSLFKTAPAEAANLVAYLRAHERVQVQEMGDFCLVRLD